jgi:hypothetical protein
MAKHLHESYQYAITVGDPHIGKSDIPEGKRLIEWIVASGKKWFSETGIKPLIVFTGDQSNDFAIVRAEVLEFWMWAYDYIAAAGFDSVSQVGNHDMNQEESAATMSVFDQRTVLARRNMVSINANTAAIGFIRDEELFFKTVMEAYKLGVRIMFTHVEFEGSQYENGTYAPHGFDLARYPADLTFITGHIHKRQKFGNVYCVGTPKPSTRSDIDEIKGIHMICLKNVPEVAFWPTPTEVCEPFRRIVVNEGWTEAQIKAIPDSPKVYVELVGTTEFVKKTARLLPPSVHEHSTYTDVKKATVVKESEGIPTTFVNFTQEYFTNNGTPPELQKAILDKVYQSCPSLKQGVK